MHKPVDVVITWVDGYDLCHQQKMTTCVQQQSIDKSASIDPTRYNQCGEIDYCVNSLFRYAPWIRTIYIVTDSQTPTIFARLAGTPYEHKLKCIDHRDIFSGLEANLPTFNSLSIESLLWRIEGLSEQFIYFNDDCFLIRPVDYDDFFCEDKLILRGNWKCHSANKLRYSWQKVMANLFNKPIRAVPRSEHRALQEQSAALAGYNKRFFHLPHIPFPLHKKTFDDFFQQHADILLNNIHYSFRNPNQIWPISLAQHLEIQKKHVIFDNTLKAIMVNGAFHSLATIKSRLTKAATNKDVAFVCMQSIDASPMVAKKWMFDWLDTHIGITKNDCNSSYR